MKKTLTILSTMAISLTVVSAKSDSVVNLSFQAANFAAVSKAIESQSLIPQISTLISISTKNSSSFDYLYRYVTSGGETCYTNSVEVTVPSRADGMISTKDLQVVSSGRADQRVSCK